MASSREYGGNDFDRTVEAIDLTLSSPEPEPRPRVIPRQSQLPMFFKKEPQAYRVTKHNRVSQSAAPAREAIRHQARPDNSNNIARILDSSNPDVLKKVLTELCQASPALCGALQRGLATHSNNRNENHIAESKGKFTTPHTRPRYYDASQSEVLKGPSIGHRQAVQKPHASQPMPRIKREVPAHLSDSNSDDDLRVPGSFPRSTPGANPVKPAQQDQAGNILTVNRASNPLSLSERLARLQQETLNESKRCGRCGDLFVRENDVCLYHPGRKTVLRGIDPRMAWTCCQRHLDDIGCKSGHHTDEETYTGHRRSTYVKPAEPIKLCSRCHEPWTNRSFECKHHPGYKMKEEGGRTVYTCCDQVLGSSGCEYGDHVHSVWSFKRPSPSPDPSGLQQKKPRIF